MKGAQSVAVAVARSNVPPSSRPPVVVVVVESVTVQSSVKISVRGGGCGRKIKPQTA